MQTEQIKNHLLTGNSITPLEALNKYGCFRLGARIYDLKEQGYPIFKKMIKTDSGKSVACYYYQPQGQMELI